MMEPTKTFKLNRNNTWRKDFKQNWSLYVLFVPIIVFFIIFSYAPMFGILMAFQDYNMVKGVFGSQWIGFANFVELFTADDFLRALGNTAGMAAFNLTFVFFAPVLLGLILSQLRYKRFKRATQLISYLPNFVSVTVVCALAKNFLSDDGIVTGLLSAFGLKTDQAGWLYDSRVPVFWLINIFLSIWQGAGWGSIIYVAGISNINEDLYEASSIDGANRWNKLLHITIPGVLPLIIMMFTMQVGLIFMTGYDKVLLLQNTTTSKTTAEVLYTFTHWKAFGGHPDYGLATASGLFQSLVGMILLVLSNWLNRKTTKMSLF